MNHIKQERMLRSGKKRKRRNGNDLGKKTESSKGN